MAFAATNIWEVQTGGHDTNNGGGFNPGNTSMATDLQVTGATGLGTSVTVSSVSYTFIARDVGHWLFIKSGTSWTPGWYKITGEAGGVATIDAAAGHAILYYANFSRGYALNTTAGCATVVSPTTGTWSIDYSQSTPISFTDLVAATTTTFTSTANPIGKNFVGNIFSITSGTGWNVVRWECSSVNSGTSTGTAGNFYSGTTIGTAASTGGTGQCGGPLASPGQASLLFVNGNSVYIAAGTYTIASATPNVATGIVSNTAGGLGGNAFSCWEGYATYRCDKPGLGSRPVIHAGSGVISSAVMWTIGGNHTRIECLSFNGNSQTTVTGLQASGNRQTVISCDALNCTARGIYASSTANLLLCSATTCSGTAGLHGLLLVAFCETYANTTVGIIAAQAVYCLSYGNTGASSDGIQSTSYGQMHIGNIAYGNGRDGFQAADAQNNYINCIAEGNTGTGFAPRTATVSLVLNCGVYNNGTNIDVDWVDNKNLITGTGSFFTNAAAGDFSLNNTSGAGAALRSVGFPTTFPRGLTASYLDIGLQHYEPTDAEIAAAVWTYPNRTLTA